MYIFYVMNIYYDYLLPLESLTRASWAEAELGEVLRDASMIHELLGNESCYSKHSKTSILELLGAHLLELWCHIVEGTPLARVQVRVEPQRVEAKVTRDVIVLQIRNPIWRFKCLLNSRPALANTDELGKDDSSDENRGKQWKRLVPPADTGRWQGL